MQDFQLRDGVPDSLTWKWTKDGKHSVSSAYNVQFEGRVRFNFHLTVWDSDAPLKCQFYAWLVVLNHCLTADNLQKRGWPNDPICSLCHLHPETAVHLLINCTYARQVWRLIFARIDVTPPVGWMSYPSLADWWNMMAQHSTADNRRRWNSVVALVWWELWKERNDRIFNDKHVSAFTTYEKIIATAVDWCSAGRRLVSPVANRP